MDNILELEQVAKSFDGQQVLQSISFHLRRGERICILGPSGCGKSTLLQIVAGLVQTDSGIIRMNGMTVEGPRHYVPPEKRPINMVFQDYTLWPHMSARQNIEFGMKQRRTPESARQERLTRLQELLGLGSLLDRPPSQLSGGQQQRVGIARALATEPDILLMDEPLSNLDVKLRADMRNELAKLLTRLSIATLYVTHDTLEAFALADRILVLHGGVIKQLAPPQELFDRPATPWVARLMGYHNRLRAEVLDNGSVRLANDQLTSREGMLAETTAGAEAIVMLHPETISVVHNEETQLDRIDTEAIEQNTFRVVVRHTIYEGNRWRYLVETKDGQELHMFHRSPSENGVEIGLQVPRERTMVFAAATESRDRIG